MTPKKYWVYIVASRSGTLYIGMTNDLHKRVAEHRSGEIGDVLKAISREKQLKGWRRSKKIALIEFTNPRWEDLAEKWRAEMSFAGEPITGR